MKTLTPSGKVVVVVAICLAAFITAVAAADTFHEYYLRKPSNGSDPVFPIIRAYNWCTR